MIRRILTTLFVIVWSNVNWSFFAFLMILGIVHINTGDPAWGWPMVMIAGATYVVYGVIVVLSPLMQWVAEDCMHDENGNVYVGELLFKTARVIAFTALGLWVTVITFLMAFGSLHGDPYGVQTEPDYAGHVDTVCRLGYWPGWFK